MKSYTFINRTYERTIVIGDIHGCYDELLALLSLINFSGDDVLITVGDFMDRGPLSWAVASFIQKSQNVFSVIGNHERRIAGVIKGTSQPAWSQLHSLSQISEEERDTWASFFESLPAVIETQHAIVVHARLDPEKSINDQEAYFTSAVGGSAIKTPTNEDGVPLWFIKLQNQIDINKPICMGHVEYGRVELVKNKLYALDTGAVKAGYLTALVLPDNKIVSIKCTTNHYEQSRTEWLKKSRLSISIEEWPVNQFLNLSRSEIQDDHEKELINNFIEDFLTYNFENRLDVIRDNLLTKFGDIPIPVERKRYYNNIKEKTGTKARLLKILFNTRDFEIINFLKFFEGHTLNQIDMEFRKFEDILE